MREDSGKILIPIYFFLFFFNIFKFTLFLILSNHKAFMNEPDYERFLDNIFLTILCVYHDHS